MLIKSLLVAVPIWFSSVENCCVTHTGLFMLNVAWMKHLIGLYLTVMQLNDKDVIASTIITATTQQLTPSTASNREPQLPMGQTSSVFAFPSKASICSSASSLIPFEFLAVI